MIPQARLQPSTSINIVRTLPLLAARALNVHVSVRTMMSPNKNSEILSTGSKTRLVSLVKFAGISMVRSLFPERDNGFKCGASRYF